MKRSIKKFLSIIFLASMLFCTLFFTGCDQLLSFIDENDENTTTIREFCRALSQDDYDTAVTMIHPDCNMDAAKLRSNIAIVENVYGVDVSEGIVVVQLVNAERNNSFSIPDGRVKDTVYVYEVYVDALPLYLLVEVIETSSDIGIYSFVFESYIDIIDMPS